VNYHRWEVNLTKAYQFFPYILYFIVSLALALCLALVWYMSPLGMGFAHWPQDHRDLLQHIYMMSYFIGIPAVLIAQIASPILFAFKKQRAAYWVPAVAIALFVACIAAILSNIG